MAKSLVCKDCGTLLRNVAEAQAHNDVTGHLNFEESLEVIKLMVCTECGKPCRSQAEREMHTRFTQHADFVEKVAIWTSVGPRHCPSGYATHCNCNCCRASPVATRLQTSEEALNTEQQMKQAKEAIAMDLDEEAQLLGVKRKKTAAAAADGGEAGSSAAAAAAAAEGGGQEGGEMVRRAQLRPYPCCTHPAPAAAQGCPVLSSLLGALML
jgi:hypothetical protein